MVTVPYVHGKCWPDGQHVPPLEFFPYHREVVVSGGAVTRTLLVAISGTHTRASVILLSFYIHVEIECFYENVVGGYVDFRITTYMAVDGCVETEKEYYENKPSLDRPGEPIGDKGGGEIRR